MHGRVCLRRARNADIPAMSAIRLAVRENVLSDPARVTPQMYEEYLDKADRFYAAQGWSRTAGRGREVDYVLYKHGQPAGQPLPSLFPSNLDLSA